MKVLLPNVSHPHSTSLLGRSTFCRSSPTTPYTRAYQKTAGRHNKHNSNMSIPKIKVTFEESGSKELYTQITLTRPSKYLRLSLSRQRLQRLLHNLFIQFMKLYIPNPLVCHAIITQHHCNTHLDPLYHHHVKSRITCI